VIHSYVSCHFENASNIFALLRSVREAHTTSALFTVMLVLMAGLSLMGKNGLLSNQSLSRLQSTSVPPS